MPEEAQQVGSQQGGPLPHNPVLDAAPSPANDRVSTDLSDIVTEAFKKTHLGLQKHAEYLGVELADLSSTALALLLNVETGKVAAGQVGDGGLFGLTARGKVEQLVSPEEHNESQSTYTINSLSFADRLTVKVTEQPAANPFLAFFVMTDGLSDDLVYARQNEFDEWAAAVDRNIRGSPTPACAAVGLLHWLASYEVKGSWDDRTLVVITRKDRPDVDSDGDAGKPECEVSNTGTE